MSKLSPMKNTKSNNISKKGQHTFLKNFKRSEKMEQLRAEDKQDRKTARKTKQARLLEAWS